MTKIFVTPAKGLQVIDLDDNTALPPEGREVEKSAYWLRREADGDVVITTTPAKTKTSK